MTLLLTLYIATLQKLNVSNDTNSASQVTTHAITDKHVMVCT